MSQTNPRKPAARAPNGSDTPPAAASSDAPAQTLPQPVHHPLPKLPHTYIPAHLKSSGPRNQYPKGRSASKSADEAPELKALRAKYGDKLAGLKETFGDWNDEELLSLLQECNGNQDIAASKILEGSAQHWEVSHKKKDKATPSSVTGGPHTAARDRAEAGGSASPGFGSGGRGGRGGRGGAPGRGGLRGGRGGPAGGRGGQPNGSAGYGKVALTHGVHGATDGTTPATEDSPAVDDVDPSAEGAPVVPEPTDASKESPATAKGPTGKAGSKAAGKAPAPAGPPKMSWAQIAKKGKPAEPPAAPVAKPSAPAPPSQPAPPQTQPVTEPAPPEEPSASEPEPAVEEPTASAEEPAASEPQPSEEEPPEEATTAPLDDWVTVSPPDQKINVELPSAAPPVEEDKKPEEPETKVVPPEPAAAPEPSPVPQPTSTAALQPTGAPPGLSPIPQPATTPSASSVTSPSTVASTAPTSVPPKTSTPRLGSSRPASRFRTTDAPVVMPGGGLPSTVFGNLSFGNAITPVGTGLGAGSGGRFGMQFGSLSLNDDFDSPAPEPAPEVPEPAAQSEAPAPAPPAEETKPAPAPAPVTAPAPVPAPVSAQTQAPAPVSQPAQPSPQPPVAPQPTAPAQPAQQSPRVLSSSTAINTLFQHAQQPTQPSLPQQVATSASLGAQQQQQPQQPTPSKVDSLTPFLQQGAPGLLSHLQQQQSHQIPSPQQQVPVSHLPPHLAQPQQLGSPAQQSQQLAGTQQQQSLPYNVGAAQHLPPHLDTTSLPQTQQPASATSISAPHPALAAQNSYFRSSGNDSAFYHAPTPPQTQLPQHLQQDYNTFSPLGQPQQTQGGHLGGFSNSPAAGEYGGYDAQRGSFYDSYGQGTNFQNRPQLAHDEPTKGGLQPSTPTNVLPGQQNLNLGQGQPAGGQSNIANPGPNFGLMPYHYYQQPAYFPPPVPAQYNPYNQYKYGPYSQPPPGPSGPGPQGLQGNKPPTTGTASPYGNYPSQSTPYDDPTTVGYQGGATSATDYQKQQPLYNQGLQNFFGNQGTGQSAPQLGGAQGARAGATSSSPENPYKGYGGGPSVGADKGATGQQATTGRATGGPGPQPQQGGYYANNQYSGQRQPPAQGYPQGDGQQYYSGYQPRNQYNGGW